MKVLLVNDYATPTAGAEILTIALRNGLRRRGHDARLFSTRAELFPGETAAEYRCFGATTRIQPLVEAINPSAVLTLRRVLREFRPDVVHLVMFLWQLSPAILPLLRRVPTLYYAMTYKAICPVGTKLLPDGSSCRRPPGRICLRSGCLTAPSWAARSVQLALLTRWIGNIDRVVAVSRAVAERLGEAGFPGVEVIDPTVRRRPRRAPLRDPPLVAYAGRLAPEKGLETLLQALRLLRRAAPDFRAAIAGDGPERARLERRIPDLGLGGRIQCWGLLPQDELERRLEAAWVQVVPSLWEEPFGLVAAEAMMRGTAVVASAAGGLRETVEHGRTGLLVPPGDPAALAGALGELLASREAAERMGAAGREIALTRFAESRHIDRFEGLYREMIARAAA